MTDTGIEPDRLRTCLEVMGELDELPVDHPDAVAVTQRHRRLFKTVKQRRRQERRAPRPRTDRAVIAATATGAPGRIDDETAGPAADVARRRPRPRACCAAPRSCYICKQPLRRGRRVLPPALPGVRRAEPGQRATPAPT